MKAIALAGAMALSIWVNSAQAESVTRDQILTEADKVADAQLRSIGDKVEIDWTWAVMEVGYADYLHVSPKGTTYEQALIKIAERVNWTPLLHEKAPFHADDFCVGQMILDLYAAHPDPEKLAPLKARLDALVDHLDQTQHDPKLTFSWCDALFMAPPVLARMSAITKDPKYIDAMDKEFWRTTSALYDPSEHLFFRDAKYIHKPDTNGKEVFWSRGNGWVVGGLAHVLQYMPADYPTRPKFESLFKDMCEKIITLQSPDGTWRSSLEDPYILPGAETSGTALFTYGFAWGINHHLLDRDKFLPAISRSWPALLSARRADGLPGYTQPEGAAPAIAKKDSTRVYSTGAYLLAATELQKLAPFDLAQPAPLVDPPIAATPEKNTKAFARYIPERMDDIAWENDRIAYRIYGPASQNNPKEHAGSGIDVWVKSVREPIINEWYKSNNYHKNRGNGLDFYEVGTSRGDGGLGIWNNHQLYNSKDWASKTMLDLGPTACGFVITYDPWDANGRKVWEHRTMTLQAGSNLTKIESTIDSDKPGEIIIGIGLGKRDGPGGKLFQDKETGVLSYWQPPEKDGTIGVGVKVDPATIVGFEEDKLNYIVLIKATAGKPFTYYAGACWDKGLDFHSANDWEKYLKDFKRE